MIILQLNSSNNLFIHGITVFLNFNIITRAHRFTTKVKLNSCIKCFVGTDKISKIVRELVETTAKGAESQVPNTAKNTQSQESLSGFTADPLTTPSNNPLSSTDSHYNIKQSDNKLDPEQYKEIQKQLLDQSTDNNFVSSSVNNNSVSPSTNDKPNINIGAGARIHASVAQTMQEGDIGAIIGGQYKNSMESKTTHQSNINQETTDSIIKEKEKEALEEYKKKMKKALDDIKELDNNKKENNNDNIKPSENPKDIKYKNQSGKDYSTNITEDTTPSNISDADLIEEMKKRELIAPDLGQISTSIKVQNNEIAIVGVAKNKIKLTQLGHSYSTQKAMEYHDTPIQPTASKDIVFEDLMIITPPQSSEDLFIETALQKHLIVVFDSYLDKYLATHYLTSKNTAYKICDKQFKVFQNEQENSEKAFISTKSQGIIALNQPLVINKEDVSRVNMDKEFLACISSDARKYIKNQVNEAKQLPYKDFNKSGITKQDCVNMCREHDKTVLTKGKHPLTSDQIKQNEGNKKKQLDKHEFKTNNIIKQTHVTKD